MIEIVLLFCLVATAASAPQSRIEIDVEELLEMVPYEQMVNLGMEYALSDPQVKTLMQYISSDKFRNNVVDIESSPEFLKLADAGAVYNIDVYALANKFNSALDIQPLSYKVGWNRCVLVNHRRQRRNPGEGLAGLVRDAADLTPLEEMKEAYKYKVNNNPEFKSLMSKLLSGEAAQVLEPIVKSKPFQDTKADLIEMGVPLEQLEELISQRLHQLFDLKETSAVSPEISTPVTSVPS